jgi:hypothetical protein
MWQERSIIEIAAKVHSERVLVEKAQLGPNLQSSDDAFQVVGSDRLSLRSPMLVLLHFRTPCLQGGT